MSKLSGDMLEQSAERARPHYSKLSYHNWDHHIVSLLGYTNKRLPVLARMGVIIDPDVIQDAVVWHDADFPLDASLYGFDSKEELAASVARQNLPEVGRDESYIEQVVTAILPTQVGKPRPTNEANLMVEADLHNVAGPVEPFLKSSLDLANERLQLGGTLPDDPKDFFQGSAKFLKIYFGQPFTYTTRDGSIFEHYSYTQTGLRNIERLGNVSTQDLLAIPECAAIMPDQWR